MKTFLAFHPFALALACAASLAAARNVDLATVPRRDTVQLTIYNSEDLTLVREMRTLTFKKGLNGLQFSWANTLIDPSSVELRFLTGADKLDLLDTTVPHDKPQQLSWNVMSEFDGDAKVEITYFTSGITWSADYVLVSDAAEKSLAFEGFVRVTNHSGEAYEDAQVRLVVGTINLVEQIAQLAQMPTLQSEVSGRRGRALVLGRAIRKAEEKFRRDETLEEGYDSRSRLGQKAIVKEGLSEYFIFSIPGTETIPNGWSKRLRAIEAAEVPFTVQYRYRPMEYGERLVRLYTFKNDAACKLGGAPLPDGMIRVFRDNGRDGLSYLAQMPTKYIAIGDKVEVNLGEDPEVIFELVKLRAARDNIWMQLRGMDVFRRVGEPGVEIDVNSAVAGWDDREVYAQRIRNYTAKPIEVEVRRGFPGHVVFRSALPGVKLHDFQTVQFTATVAAGEKADCLYELIRHQDRNSKQSNVTLAEAKVAL